MAQPKPQNGTTFQATLSPLNGKNLQLRNPWRRFFAKNIDQLLIIVLALPSFALIALTIEVVSSLLNFSILHTSEWVYNGLGFLIATTFSVLYDGILLASWGTTPGRKLTGIIVTNQHGEKLGCRQSFQRAFWANGLIGIFSLNPIAWLIFMLYQKNRLHRTGFTSWDEPDGHLVYRV